MLLLGRRGRVAVKISGVYYLHIINVESSHAVCCSRILMSCLSAGEDYTS